MKPLAWLIAALLAGNAILLAVLLGRQPSAPTAAVVASTKPGSTTNNPASDQALLRALESGDPAALTAAGLPPETIRAFAAGRAYVKQQERIRALRAKTDRDTLYWRREFGPDGMSAMPRELRAEISKIQRDYRNELRAALGTDSVAVLGGSGALASFLPADIRDQLRRIDDDYGEMMSEIYSEAAGVELPSDKKKLELLKTERERDIATLLGSELYQQYLSRTSPSAHNVRSRYGSVIRDEAEYQDIFALQKAFDDRFPLFGADQAAAQKARREAQPGLDQAIAAVLGPERAQEAQRNLNPEYQTLTALSTRLNLPADTAKTIYASRDAYATQAQLIFHDDDLPREQRTAQLQALAQQIENQLQKTLGAGGAQAYAERAVWLRALKNGNAFSLNPAGAVTTITSPRK